MKQSTASKQAARYSPKNSKDSMSHISSMQQMQLQMAMDRKSKLLDTISNLEKKMADTSDLVVQNLK